MKVFRFSSTDPLKPIASYYIVIGAILLFFGILVYLVPNLLEMLVASVFIIAGGSLLLLGIRISRMSKSGKSTKVDNIFDEIDFDRK